MEALEALRIASEEFRTRLALVTDAQWQASTPCPEWNVGQLVNHMLLGSRMTVQLLDGMSREEVIAGLDDDLMADNNDPLASFNELAEGMQSRFAGPGGLDGTVSHPMGDIPRTTFVGFRVMDNGVHAWDLAQGIGAAADLDADLVEFMWNDVQPSAAMLPQLGIFGTGASGTVGDDAPLQTRYLDLIGRRP